MPAPVPAPTAVSVADVLLAEHAADAPVPRCATVLPERFRCQVGPQETLLTALERAGIDWPSSCRNGTCRTCIGRLAAGRICHLVEWPGLSAEEKREGFILPCIARARSDVVLAREVPR